MRQRILLPSVAAALFLALGASPALGAGNITTIAGPGASGTPGDGGPATQAFIGSDVGVTALPDGGFLIAHQASPAVRRVLPDGTITTVAGNGVAGYSGDGGPATAASFDGVSVAVPAPNGGYLIADPNNNVVRRVAPDGTISTVAGVRALGAGFGGDGGPATSAQLSFPVDVAFMPDGSYIIADKDNQRVRRVDTSGNISTVAGGGGSFGDGGPATAAQLAEPAGVTPTPDGGYLIADASGNRVRKVAADGTITTVAGTGTAGETGDGAPATAAELNRPAHTALESDGSFLIADDSGGRVRRVAPDNTISTVAGTTPGFGGDGGPATAAQLNRPLGISVLPSRDILIADASNGRVRLVDENPPAPTLTGTTPTSPANDNAPKILGTAAPGTTVTLFTNDTCTGAAAGAGTAADFAGPGIAVTVPDNSTTTFHGQTTDGSGNGSPCSTSALTYVESTPTKPLPPPIEGKTVNAVPVKGSVLVKLPKNASAKATAPVFVPLESIGRQLPVGSTLDTKRGTVKLTAAANARGATQHGNFSGGLFRFGQTRKNPLTTLTMTGGGLSACKIKLPPGGAAKRVKRRRSLFSSVKGHFRTRGRNSTATVRGTSWTMTDTCAGTLTSVKTGTVAVFDLRKHRTKLVRAGHSYLAHAAPLRKH